MATATEGRASIELVFDTFAWVEVLEGTPLGREVYALLAAHDVGTPSVVLAELADLLHRRVPDSRGNALETVRASSATLDLPADVAEAAGQLRASLRPHRKGIGIVDCIVLETARAHGAELVTGDPHLKGLPGVRFLEAPA